MKVEIAKAIALLTAEYDLPAFGPERIEMWMGSLSRFPAGSVTKAVNNYIQTNKFKPQLADIVQGCAAQLDGNWLGAEEAFALIPKDESQTGVMTEESAQAAAAAETHLSRLDYVAARMAFKEAYLRLVEKAKLEGRMPRYFPSLGTNPSLRVTALAGAVQKGFLSLDAATAAAPEYSEDIIKVCGIKDHPLLAPPTKENRERLRSLLLTLKVGE